MSPFVRPVWLGLQARVFSSLIAVALLLSVPGRSAAQDPRLRQDTLVFRVDPILVTATRGPRGVSDIPAPVSVVGNQELVRFVPNTVSDLFRDLPGLDVTGVGVSQARPEIRGQGGQRILLLSDGLRMNNTRRQRDFGELPALVDVDAVEQVEVVRGPASVLYGSDAIAGVINIVTRVPTEDGFHGSASYLFGTAGDQNKVSARVSGRSGAFSVQGGGMWRDAGSYRAPSDSFGNIGLADEVTVDNSGVEDQSFDARVGLELVENTSVFAKFEHYKADNAGFGSVDPALFAPGDPNITILYPDQRFDKMTFGVLAQEMENPLADRLSLTAYGQDNERSLEFQSFIPFGIPGLPDAGLDLANHNFTDIRTYGFRAEARKLLPSGVLITYGVDGFRDRALGTDNDTSIVVGFGPPQVELSNAPSIPTAEFLSLGGFVQGEVDVGDRVSLVGGGRYQNASAETFSTQNLTNTPASESTGTFVWALNGLVKLDERLDLVLSSGRGFRSPNLVELFFDGAVAEAGAYQIASDNLKAETSLSVDVGARYHAGPVFLETFVFRNKVSNGIRGRPVLDSNGDQVVRDGLDVYQNVNVDQIVFTGIEVNTDVRFGRGVSAGASFSELRAKDAIDPENPIGESYSSKVTGRLGYQDPAGRFWGQWDIRQNGEQKEVALLASNPLGDVIPGFVVQNLRAGVRLFQAGGTTHQITVALRNLTNELYAESSNASFFRPEPKRNLALSYSFTF